MSAGSERPAARGALFVRFWNPSHPTLRGRIERLAAPGYGFCMRCGRPWNRVEGHMTRYENGSSCLPLCESCWSSLLPAERLPYYEALVDEWIRQTPSEAEEYEQKRRLIEDAVMQGA